MGGSSVVLLHGLGGGLAGRGAPLDLFARNDWGWCVRACACVSDASQNKAPIFFLVDFFFLIFVVQTGVRELFFWLRFQRCHSPPIGQRNTV